jgi:hypothetical protein
MKRRAFGGPFPSAALIDNQGVEPMTAKQARSASAWFDEASSMPIIDQQARRLDSFISTMADGQVEAREIKAQQERLVKLMQEIEPLLDENLHAKITELLCELTAYDLMQILHTMQEARPKTVFRG